MAGVKGRSGGARAGSGRKPRKPIIDAAMKSSDPEAFLRALVGDPAADMRLRLDAAKALLPYVADKPAEAGKKDRQKERAEAVALGKFAAQAPPMAPLRH